MATNLEIILRVKDDGSVTLQKAATNVKALGDAAQQADAKLKSAAKGSSALSESSALSRREFGQLAATGVAAFGLLDRALGNTDNKLAKFAQNASQIALGFAAGGPVGAGIAALGVGIGLLLDHLNAVEAAAQKARAELVKPFDDARAALESLNPPSDKLVATFEKMFGATEQVAQGMANMAKQSQEYRDALQRTLDLQQAVAEKQLRLEEIMSRPPRGGRGFVNSAAVEEYKQKLSAAADAAEELAIKQQAAELAAGALALRLREQEITAGALITRWEALNSALLTYAQNTSAAALVEARWAQYNRAVASSLRMTESQMAGTAVTLRDLQQEEEKANAESKRLAEEGLRKLEDAARRVRDTIRGLVENALQPTSVTMEDLNAALAGKYIPKWDEFRRRVEAIASGTGIDQFGPKFKAQLEMVQAMFKNLSLDEIAAKFKDFSLFADMDIGNIKDLIDFGPIEAQVAQQVDAIIGKAKAMKVAFDEVWASLSTQKKIDLANALGLDAGALNIENLKNQIQGAVTGATAAVGDTTGQALTGGFQKAATAAGGLAGQITGAVAPSFATLKESIAANGLPALTAITDYTQKSAQPAMLLLGDTLRAINVELKEIKANIENDIGAFDALESKIPGYEAIFRSIIENALVPMRNALFDIAAALGEIVVEANKAATALEGLGGKGKTDTAPTTPLPPGYARGGAFRVEGQPGIDTNLVRFRATRGEIVTITPPGQRRGGSNQFTFDFRGADFSGADPNLIHYLTDAVSEMFERKMSVLAQNASSMDGLTGN